MEHDLAVTTEERKTIDLGTQINGWGADLDPSVRPGVPRDKAPGIGVDQLYPKIEPQVAKIKVYKSTEHMKMPPVFGTSCPPQGLSGFLRDAAYSYSEGQLTHWLTLMLADRINVAEDFLVDISNGRIPNLYKEMGLGSEWKYNRKNFLFKIAGFSIGAIALVALVRSRSKPDLRRA